MKHVRVIGKPSGRFGLVTDFLGLPINRTDCRAAGLDTDPQDLGEAEAKRIAARMDLWIEGQNEHARRQKK